MLSQRIVRRYLPWVLVLLGISALGAHDGDMRRMDTWAWVALVSLAAAPLIGVRGGSPLQWLLTSIPFWIFGNAIEALLLVAVGLTIASMAAVAVVPTLVGRRVRRSQRQPLPHLASGPLVPVAPQVFTGGQRSRILKYAARALLLLAGALFLLIAAGAMAPELAGLPLAALIIAATFTFGNWFADRVRLRVDEVGVHGRMMFVEHTAKWTEISGLRLRYLFMPGYAVRMVYYVVESPRHEVAFPSSMKGARELQASIEAATGLAWPDPEITPNL